MYHISFRILYGEVFFIYSLQVEENNNYIFNYILQMDN